MIIDKINLLAQAAGLTRSFMLQQIASLDHLAVYLYLARGAVSKHRHQLRDELFYLVTGSLKIESESGIVTVRAGELAMVPHGVEHASSAMSDTTVMMVQALTDPERKNGHGRTTAAQNQPSISHLVPRDIKSGLAQPFFSLSLTQVDEIAVRAAWCQGAVGWHRHPDHDELLLVLEGQLDIGIESGLISLSPNELVVIPRKRVHRLSTFRQTLLVSMIHNDLSAAAQMGYSS